VNRSGPRARHGGGDPFRIRARHGPNSQKPGLPGVDRRQLRRAIAGVAPTARASSRRIRESGGGRGRGVKNFDRRAGGDPSESGCEKSCTSQPMFDADVVINLPKLKTHSAQIFFRPVKNVFGCIPGLKKAKYHKMAPEPPTLARSSPIFTGHKNKASYMDAVLLCRARAPRRHRYPAAKSWSARIPCPGPGGR
jgi:hypothetical protein